MSLHFGSRKASLVANEWCSFISDNGTNTDIDIDNDGEMPDTRILVDLSQMLSQRLGKQMSQMASYRVNYIGIQLVNVNDGNDNDGAAEFSGRVHWFEPSKHRIDAMQLARQVEKRNEEADIDSNSWILSLAKRYIGMRFNWDADNQIAAATAEGFSALSGQYWDLKELFTVYNQMTGDVMDSANNKLWSDRTGYESQMGFTAAYSNKDEVGYHPSNSPFVFQSDNPIEVLGGMLMIDVENSSTDTPQIIDDDYDIMVTVGVSGWSDF